MSKLVMNGMDLSNVKNIRQDSSREHIEIEFRDGSIERFKRSNKVVCSKCGFEGESSDYDVAVKQQKKEFPHSMIFCNYKNKMILKFRVLEAEQRMLKKLQTI